MLQESLRGVLGYKIKILHYVKKLFHKNIYYLINYSVHIECCEEWLNGVG